MQIFMMFAFVGALFLAFSFGKFLIECDLTQDWNAGNWGIFRLYKEFHNKPNLTIAEFYNIKTKEQDEKIDELLAQLRTKGPIKVYGQEDIYKLSDVE